MASSAGLTDSELREKLKLLGEDVGPITPTTRRVYQKRLDSLLGQQKRRLNALSSDDSETERSNERNLRKKRFNHRPSTSSPTLPHTPSGTSSPGLSKENKPLREIFKTPLTTNPRYSTSRTPTTGDKNGAEYQNTKTPPSRSRRSIGKAKGPNLLPFEVETSDSERDTGSQTRTLQLRNAEANHSTTDKNKEANVFKRAPRKSFLSSTPNGDNLSTRRPIQQHEWKKHPVTTFSTTKRFTGYTLNGYVPDTLNGEFQNAKTTGKSTNYSHCVSWMLVFATVAFFVTIGVFYYMSTVQKTSTTGVKSSLDFFQCEFENVSGCIPTEHFNSVLTASRVLHSLLSDAAGRFECQTSSGNRNLSVPEAKSLLLDSLNEQKVDFALPFDKLFEYTLSLTLKNPSWRIKLLSAIGEVLKTDADFHEISALESKDAAKSLFCRLQHSVYWTLSNLILLVVVLVSVYFGFVGLQFWKKRKELQEREFFHLVDRIIDILQKPVDNGPNIMPVAHIRDQLIPIKQRKDKKSLWERAVSFIEENESRVEVDYSRVQGEEHKIWRWLPSPTDETEAGKHGKVWQGQAFCNISRGKSSVSFSPTPCLKIRNMFDPAVEYGEDWQVCVQDSILEKCEGNDGIVHIAIDTSGNEGCTYMLCNSTENAGKAYDAMHGWWFDGRLVTIKYLRLQRYLERFAEAENCCQPLKPSNNKRLSLSAPFFSSALERS